MSDGPSSILADSNNTVTDAIMVLIHEHIMSWKGFEKMHSIQIMLAEATWQAADSATE